MAADAQHLAAQARLHEILFYPNYEYALPSNYTQILATMSKNSPPKQATQKFLKDDIFGSLRPQYTPRLRNVWYPMDHLLSKTEQARNARKFRKYTPKVKATGARPAELGSEEIEASLDDDASAALQGAGGQALDTDEELEEEDLEGEEGMEGLEEKEENRDSRDEDEARQLQD